MKGRGTPVIRPILGAASLCLPAVLAMAQEPVQGETRLPFRTDSAGEAWRSGLSGIFVAVFVLAVVAAGLYFWRKRIGLPVGPAPGSRSPARLEWARRVSPRTTLMVVNWRGKEYLLAENGTATQLLDSHAAAEEPPK